MKAQLIFHPKTKYDWDKDQVKVTIKVGFSDEVLQLTHLFKEGHYTNDVIREIMIDYIISDIRVRLKDELKKEI